MEITYKNPSKKIIFILGFVFSINAYSQESSPCKVVTYNQVVSAVSDNFPKIMLKSDIKELGTNNPTLVFDKSDIKITKVFSIAFKATSKTNEKNYIAIYDCNSKEIEYSIND